MSHGRVVWRSQFTHNTWLWCSVYWDGTCRRLAFTASHPTSVPAAGRGAPPGMAREGQKTSRGMEKEWGIGKLRNFRDKKEQESEDEGILEQDGKGGRRNTKRLEYEEE